MARRNGLSTSERTIEVVFPGYKRDVKLKGTYMELNHELESFAPVLAFDGERPVLMGCFSQGSKKAFTLVNMEDPGRKLSNRVTVVFDAPKTLLIHGKDGSRQVEVPEKWEVELDFGEGLFVEIVA